MHIHLEQKKTQYNIDIHKDKFFESQLTKIIVYNLLHSSKNAFVNTQYVKVGCGYLKIYLNAFLFCNTAIFVCNNDNKPAKATKAKTL